MEKIKGRRSIVRSSRKEGEREKTRGEGQREKVKWIRSKGEDKRRR